MPASFEDLVAFFRSIGSETVSHTGITYIGHCFNVYRDMKQWGYDEELAQAGLFHSIYGTGLFQRFKVPLKRRGEIRDLIGERAERLAYLNCSIDYESFDDEFERAASPFQMRSRLTGETVAISDDDFDALLKIQLVDRLEQVPRSEVRDFRRDAFQRIADRIGGRAIREFDRVFATPKTPEDA